MSSRPHHFPWRCKSPAQKAVKELTGHPFFSYTYLDNTGATLCYRGKSVRVIRCPVCDEPLPGFANFCAACGATLIPSPTSTTARVSRPRTLKVPHFFAVGGAGARPALDDPSLAETMKFGERPSHLPPNSTVPLGQRASVGLLEEHI